MRLVILFTLFFLGIGIMSCDLGFENEQRIIEGCPFVLEVVHQPPVLIGGIGEVQSRLVYPEEALEKGIEGRVVIRFIVNKEGIPIEPKLASGIGYGTYEAAKKALIQSEFVPGLQNGELVCVNYSLPISFSIK